jgi:hypothetical protein
MRILVRPSPIPVPRRGGRTREAAFGIYVANNILGSAKGFMANEDLEEQINSVHMRAMIRTTVSNLCFNFCGDFSKCNRGIPSIV